MGAYSYSPRARHESRHDRVSLCHFCVPDGEIYADEGVERPGVDA